MKYMHPKYVSPLAASITISKLILICVIYYVGAPYVSEFIEWSKSHSEGVDSVVTEKANNVFDVFSPFLLCNNSAERDGAKIGIAICVLMVLVPLAILLVVFAFLGVICMIGSDYCNQKKFLEERYIFGRR